MRTFAVLNMKGGVGKTTTAVNLSAGLAAHGYRTLLIDADPQGNAGQAFRVGGQGTLGDLMLDRANVDDVVVSGVRDGLDVIPSRTDGFALEQQLAAAMQRETILSRALDNDPAIGRYDAIVLDTSPSMNLLTYNSLLVAREVIIPVGMDLMAVIGARQTLGGIQEVQRLWPDRGLEIAAVLPTFVDPRTRATRATLEVLENDPVIKPHLVPGIRQCLDLTYAAATHATIWEYAPRSRGAEDFTALLDAIHVGKKKRLVGGDANLKVAAYA